MLYKHMERLEKRTEKRTMRIKDVLSIEQGFFKFIKYTIDNFTFTQLDLLFLSKYGEREISPIIESLLDENQQLSDEKLQVLGDVIRNMFAHSWDSQNAVLTAEYNPLENYYETLETTRNSTNNSTINTDNNTYAFNSLDAVDKDNTNQTSEGGLNEIVTQTKKGLANGNYSDMVEQALKVKAIRLVDIVFNDIKWFVSLNLYT